MTGTGTESEGLEGLAERARSGDDGALDTLLRRVQPRVYRWALVRTGSPDDADDVSQAVLLTLHRKLDDFQGRSRFTSWLYRMTMNEAIDSLRARAARERMREGVAAERRPPTGPPGVEEVTDARLVELVRTFFTELPERQRQVFDLVDLQGLGPSEVAEMLEMNRSTVRVHLFRARRAIRRRILEGHPALADDYGG